VKYQRLGNSGLVVSRISFGAMTFGQGELVPGFNNAIDQNTANEMVARCLDAGVNLFDTADAYMRGESEIMLGKALGSRRKDVVISTKVGLRMSQSLIDVGLSYRHIVAACERSLQRLGTDHIDVYQIHIPDPYTPFEETAAALDHLVEQGKVRYIGFSNLPAWMVAYYVGLQERLCYARFVVGQMYYSLLGRDLELELVPCFEKLGIGVMGWGPLAGGFLSGKYTRENPAPRGMRREKFSFPPIDIEKGYEVVAVLKRIAGQYGATPSQVAIAWTLTRPFMTTVLVGATRMDQLESNLAASEIRMDEVDIGAIDNLTRPVHIYPGYMLALGYDSQIDEATRHG
jgi:aryl-alcohol dehydrogenase-like predicted oxidoreductase